MNTKHKRSMENVYYTVKEAPTAGNGATKKMTMEKNRDIYYMRNWFFTITKQIK